VIDSVVIHLSNEQPLVADIYELPAASDSGLLCTNLRMLDGKIPVFIDRTDATFFFPYHIIRFLEIPAGAVERHQVRGGAGRPRSREATRELETIAPPAVIALSDGSTPVEDG
jgi:hypothetical protein